MVFLNGYRRGRIAAQIPRTIHDLLMDVADHDLQIEILYRLPPDRLQLFEILAQRIERSGLPRILTYLSQGIAYRIGLLGSIHRKDLLFRELYREEKIPISR